MSFYPPKISRRFHTPKNAGKAAETNVVGTGASFVCGSFVRFFLHIDVNAKIITEAKFKSNGCGFTVAAAEVLTGKIGGKCLTELHGLDKVEIIAEIEKDIEKFPAGRRHCLEICVDALQNALADFRAFQIEEFAGEKALICTCFGVSEEHIEKVIADNQIETTEQVKEICQAGGGCGSCRFLIQEMIDVYREENL